jgi:hypothetical protein
LFSGVWQAVAMDSLKFHPDLPCPTLRLPAGGLPMKCPYGVASPQGERPAAVFYPFGHPPLYAYGIILYGCPKVHGGNLLYVVYPRGVGDLVITPGGKGVIDDCPRR